jgi:hypothetical protein
MKLYIAGDNFSSLSDEQQDRLLTLLETWHQLRAAGWEVLDCSDLWLEIRHWIDSLSEKE